MNKDDARVEDDEMVEMLTKMLDDRKSQFASCNRMLELLQPEWDKFEARTGHDTYVARDYADHTSAARRHIKEIAALEYALSHQATTDLRAKADALARDAGLSEGMAIGLLAALEAAREALHSHYVDWDGEPEDAVPLQEARANADAALAAYRDSAP